MEVIRRLNYWTSNQTSPITNPADLQFIKDAYDALVSDLNLAKNAKITKEQEVPTKKTTRNKHVRHAG